MRESVYLYGDSADRPIGIERGLVRAGFALSEGNTAPPGPPPDLALVMVPDAGDGLEQALQMFNEREWTGVPVIVILASGHNGGIARALALGAADAMASPVDHSELSARLEARLRSRAEVMRAAGAGSLEADRFPELEAVQAVERPDDLLEKLVDRLGEGLRASHCACLVPSSDGRSARVVAAFENPTLRNMHVDLFHYPEVVEAVVSGRTVHAYEVLRDGLFLAHLAQWPDSPEVREMGSAAAIPLVTQRTVRAVIVIRTRRGESPLTADRVSMVEQMVNSVVALLEREDRGRSAA
jgi:hypothetical protein